MLRRSKKNSGFTLVEVMAGMVIFCVGCLGLLGMMTSSSKANRDSRILIESMSLASTELDRQMIINTACTNGHLGTNVDGAGSNAGAYGAQNGSYEVSWTASRQSMYSSNYCVITVTVRAWDVTKMGSSGRGDWRYYSVQGAMQL